MSPTKLFPRILIICLLPLLASVSAAADVDFGDLFRKANAKADSGDLAGAVADYNRILQEKPKFDNVWIRRAFAKWHLEDASGALADLAMAIELNPKHPDGYRLRANIRISEDEYEGALADINKAIELAPNFAPAYVLRARILHTQGADAVTDLDHAIKLDPKLREAVLVRAQIHAELGNATWALADYDRAIAMAPEVPAAYVDRAWVKFSQADWSGTIADGKKHVELTESNIFTLRVIGFAQFGQGDYAEAIKTLTQGADLNTVAVESLPDILYVRHVALVRTGGADDRLAKTLAGWKEGSWARAIGGFLAGQLTEEQLDDLTPSSEIDEESRGRVCEANFYIGMMRLKAGDRSSARLRFEACIAAARPSFIEHTLAQEELKKFKKR